MHPMAGDGGVYVSNKSKITVELLVLVGFFFFFSNVAGTAQLVRIILGQPQWDTGFLFNTCPRPCVLLACICF